LMEVVVEKLGLSKRPREEDEWTDVFHPDF
jgi:hypothetical protein